MHQTARTRALWSAAVLVVAAAPVAWGASSPAAGAASAGEASVVWREPVVTSIDVSGGRGTVAAREGVLVALDLTGEGDALAGPTQVRASTDGIDWAVTASLDDVGLVDVVAGDGGFVAVGTTVDDAGTTRPVAATSPDGADWSVVELDGGPLGGRAVDVAVTPLGIVVGGGRATADDAHLPAAWLAADGQAWQVSEPDAFDLGGREVYPFASVLLHEVGGAGDAAVVVGQFQDEGGPFEMLSWSSTDGVTWTPMPGLGEVTVFLRGMASGAPGAVLAADSDDPAAEYDASFTWRAVDGESWGDRVSLPALPDGDEVVVGDVAYGNPWFVAVGDDRTEWDAGRDRRPAVWTSRDGVAWERVPQDDLAGPALGPDASARLVVPDGGRWYVFGTTNPAGEGLDVPVVWRGETSGAGTGTPTPAPTTTTPGPDVTPSPDETTPVPTAVPAGGEDVPGEPGASGPAAGLLAVGAAIAAAVAVTLGVVAARRRARHAEA